MKKQSYFTLTFALIILNISELKSCRKKILFLLSSKLF